VRPQTREAKGRSGRRQPRSSSDGTGCRCSLGVEPVVLRDPGLAKDLSKQRHSDVSFLARVGNADLVTPLDHEPVLPARERALVPEGSELANPFGS